ncbi:MAG: glycoside hydrolase N-terminal domain-containing protein [Spartobacteria bacterium]
MTNFAEVSLDFNHKAAQDYRRSLNLNEAIALVSYKQDGVTYKREYFASYPDNVVAVRLTADQKGALSFTVRAEIPYLDANDRADKSIEDGVGPLLPILVVGFPLFIGFRALPVAPIVRRRLRLPEFIDSRRGHGERGEQKKKINHGGHREHEAREEVLHGVFLRAVDLLTWELFLFLMVSEKWARGAE